MGPASRAWRTVVSGIAVVIALAASADAQAQREVRVVTWGGPQEDAQKKIVGPSFEQEKGIKVVYDTWNGTIAPIRAMVETKNVTHDTYPFNIWDAVAGCDEGILERLDAKELGVDPSDFYEGAIEPCGIGSDMASWIFSWNKDRHPEWTEATGPQTLPQIFDTQKFPGKRGLRKRAYATFEHALMGDGVPNKDLYRVLGTKEGLTRAFARLDTIKKQTVWLDNVAQMPLLLSDGETDISMIHNAGWYKAVVQDKKNFGVMWRDQLYYYNMWVIPKGSPRAGDVKAYLQHLIQPKRQAEIADKYAYAPSRKSALQLVSPEVRKNLPSAHFENELAMSAKFWADNLDSYTKELQGWLTK